MLFEIITYPWFEKLLFSGTHFWICSFLLCIFIEFFVFILTKMLQGVDRVPGESGSCQAAGRIRF
jgi:hypothetical protein